MNARKLLEIKLELNKTEEVPILLSQVELNRVSSLDDLTDEEKAFIKLSEESLSRELDLNLQSLEEYELAKEIAENQKQRLEEQKQRLDVLNKQLNDSNERLRKERSNIAKDLELEKQYNIKIKAGVFRERLAYVISGLVLSAIIATWTAGYFIVDSGTTDLFGQIMILLIQILGTTVGYAFGKVDADKQQKNE